MLVQGLLIDQEINVLKIEREYHLFVPEVYDNAPVVVLFHGHTGSNDDIIGLDGETAPYKVWLKIAEEENLIVLIPNGLNTSESQKGWNDCRLDASSNSEANDVEFISNLLDFVINKYEANANQVYLNGTSNGGHLCIRLANEISEKITAFASIVASNAVNSECTDASEPVSALFMNGTDDPFLPYEGGQMVSNRGEVFSAESTVDYWVSRNACNDIPVIQDLPDTNMEDESTVKEYVYQNGTKNTEVVLLKIMGGGHTEPSKVERYNGLITLLLGKQNGDIEMAEEVWAFFKGKSK